MTQTTQNKISKFFFINRSEMEGRFDPNFYNAVVRDNKKRLENSKNKVVKFRELISEFKGGPMGFHLHTYDYVEKGIPLLRIGNLKDIYLSKTDNFIYISNEKHNELKNSKVKEGDLIFSKAGKVGEMSIVPKGFGEANLNQALSRITLNEKVIAEYVYLFFKTNLGGIQIQRFGSGRAVQDDLKMSEVEHFKIPLPNKEIQKQIISVYQNANTEKIQKERHIEVLIKSIDTYLLNELGITIPIKNNKAKSRMFISNLSEVTSGRLDPDYQNISYKNIITEIKKSNFPIADLKDITEVLNSGKTPASYEYSEEVTDFPIIKVGSYTNDFINLEKVDYVLTKQRLKAQNGDIFILSAAHQSEYVGRHIKMLNEEPQTETSYVGELICVRANEKVNSIFLFSLLKTDIYKTLINREKTGQTSHVYGKDLKKIPIPLPDKQIQDKISKHIKDIQEQIKTLQADAKRILDEAKQEVEKMIIG